MIYSGIKGIHVRWSYEQGSIVCIDSSEGKRQLELVSLGLVKDTFLVDYKKCFSLILLVYLSQSLKIYMQGNLRLQFVW